MGAGVTGLFGTAQFIQSEVKPSFSQAVMRFMPNGDAPLFGMTSMLKTETATQVEHGFFQETMLFPEFTLAANISATDNVLTVVSVNNLIPNQVHQISSTNENVLIENIVSATQIRVTRGFGTIAAASASSGVKAFQVGSAFEQGSLRPQSLKINPVRVTNFCQIFRDSWAITQTAKATLRIISENEVQDCKRHCAAFHSANIEKALFFSQKVNTSRNGQPLTTMDGLLTLISNLSYYPTYYSAPNVTTAGSTTNYTQLEAALDPCFNQKTDMMSGNSRILFVGGEAKKVINNILRRNCTYEVQDDTKPWGLVYSKFKITRGIFEMVEHPLFNTNATWAKMAVAVDFPTYNLAYLRNTTEMPYGMTNNESGQDAEGGTLTTELTQLVKNIPANAVIYNLTAAAVG
jgi:hypothetical protein